MSAPLVWIFLPALVGILLHAIRNYQIAVVLAGVAVGLSLAGLAWYGAGEEDWVFAAVPVTLRSELVILGRRLIIAPADAPILITVYLGAAFWYGGAIFGRVDKQFVPLSLVMCASFVAALSVEPFLYAALFFEISVLTGVVMLSTPGERVPRGVLRYLIFQTLGLPLILFIGWLLAGVEASPGDTALVRHTVVLLGLGFAFLLGIFPFHSWIPMLAGEAHPYPVAFILFMQTMVVQLFGLAFLERYLWLRILPVVYTVLLLGGGMMVIIGGWFMAFERNLGRMLGLSIMLEIGLVLLAIGNAISSGGRIALLPVIFAALLPRGLSLGVWALGLDRLRSGIPMTIPRQQRLQFRNIQGAARKMPIAAASVVLSHFSMAGLPLLAGFPIHLAYWSGLAVEQLPYALLALGGSLGAIVGALRSLAVLVMGEEDEKWQSQEGMLPSALLFVGSLALVVIGLMPQNFLRPFGAMLTSFKHLLP